MKKISKVVFFTNSSNLYPIITNFYCLSLKKSIFKFFVDFTIFKEIQSGTKIRIFVGIKYRFIYYIFRSYHIHVKVMRKSNIMRGGKILIVLIFLYLRTNHIVCNRLKGWGGFQNIIFDYRGGGGIWAMIK